MLMIDAHAHIFPDFSAPNAVRGIGNFYGLPCHEAGTLDGLVRAEAEAGIARFIVSSVATTPGQVRPINRFLMRAAAGQPDRIVPFASLHPDVPGLEARVDEIIAAGFAGVKLHPDLQRFRIDEPGALRMLALLEGRLPVLVHAGDSRYDFSGPERLLRVHEALPGLTLICAHLGGWSEWERAAELLPGLGLYVDTSSSLYALSPRRAAESIRAFGADRVLFGTDYPIWTPKAEVERFEGLPLTDRERELILGRNAARLFFGKTD